MSGAGDAGLTVTTADGITEITLDRPSRRNALDTGLCRVLTEAVRAFDADPAARVAVITGRDPAFCAGMDLDELGRTGVRFGSDPTFDQVLRAVTKPVIGAVNGPAVTAGLELALSCDFLIASERARFADTRPCDLGGVGGPPRGVGRWWSLWVTVVPAACTTGSASWPVAG